MGKEIERKFLVSGESWKEGATGTDFQQGYLASDLNTVRVRIAGGTAYLTIKSKTKGISRDEFEYEIPVADAEAMLKLCPESPISKTRYEVQHGAHLWEVDVFHGANEGLVMAEVELASEEEDVDLPGWAGEEVSHDPRYYNSALSKSPYTTW